MIFSRSIGLVLLMCATLHGVQAQQIDSVHVFDALAEGTYTSASANAMAWHMHQTHARHVTLKGEELEQVREAMDEYAPAPHRPQTINDLTHVAMVFTHGRPTAMGVTGDLDRFINFTARTEYRIDSFSEHIKVRALLLELLMNH